MIRQILARSFPFLLFGCVMLSAETVEIPVSKVSVSGIAVIEMKAFTLNVDIAGAPGDMVTIEAEGISSTGEVRSQRSGGRLKVWVNGTVGSGKLRCTVPQTAILTIATVSGDVSVEKMAGKNIEVRTVSGSIDIKECSAELTMESASGNINLDRCAGFMNLRSLSGRLNIDKGDGDVLANTASGNQDFKDLRGHLRAVSASGSIDINGFAGSCHLQTASSNIDGDDVTLTGDSFCKSISGSIALKLKNPDDGLRFDLESESGELSARGNSGRKTLDTGNGKILVTGRTVSGSQKYE